MDVHPPKSNTIGFGWFWHILICHRNKPPPIASHWSNSMCACVSKRASFKRLAGFE